MPRNRSEWIALMDSCGYDSRRMSARLGISTDAVAQRIRKRGMYLRPKYRYRTHEQWRALLDSHETLTAAAASMGIATSTLSKMLTEFGVDHGFPAKHIHGGRLHGVDSETLDALVDMHGVGGAARRLGVSSATMIRELKRRMIPGRRSVLGKVPSEDLLRDGETVSSAARRLHVPRGTLQGELRRRGIR